jgi:cytochrome P450
MEEVERCIEQLNPDSWKGYTVGDNTNKHLAQHPWRMDDERLMYPFYERIQRAGKNIVCVHKGLYPPSVSQRWPHLTPYAAVDDVGKAAKDWQTFSSDAPFRVPIPSEEDVRSMRQLPVETDPPDHTEYRDLVEPVFRRAKDPAMVARVGSIIDGRVRAAVAGGTVEVVRQFALPIQSEALAVLLNVPESEAAIWIGWGTHVFRDGGNGAKKGAALEEYLQSRFDRAEAVVQRMPDYLNPVDRPSLNAYTDSNAAAANKTFGRRINLVSFRWLSGNEI